MAEISVPIETKDRTNITSSILTEKNILGMSKYDLRNDIFVRVKDQKSSNSCWTFSTISVLESTFLKTKGENLDFSERHMNYATSKTFVDGINSLGYNKEVNGGGNALLGLSYVTSGRGPIDESEMPFTTNESRISLSELEGKHVTKKVDDYIIFPSIEKIKQNGSIKYMDSEGKNEYTEAQVLEVRNSIKEHLLNYGAVTCSVVSGSIYNEYYNYNSEYPSYYCDNSNLELNHQVTIIGWDDNYSVDNFNSAHRPNRPGAYLVLNSYGTESAFKEGCFYISYEDTFVENSVVGITKVSDKDYYKLYQHDPLGVCSNVKSANHSTLYGANVFTRDSSKSEKITQISIGAEVSAKCEIYVNPYDGELRSEKLKKVKNGIVTIKPGYTTIDLDEEVKLIGDKFAVAIKYMSENNSDDVYIGIEAQSEKSKYFETATSNQGESFVSTDSLDNWGDLSNVIKNANICIKAFTKENDNDKITYEVDSENNIFNISPSTNLLTFISNYTTEETEPLAKSAKIYGAKNELLNEDQTIGTGMKLTYDDENYNTLIVKGDLNGDGLCNHKDLALMKMHIIKLNELDGAFIKASDINLDGKCANVIDFDIILDVFLGNREI